MVEDLNLITNLGVGVGSLLIMFQFAKWIAEKAFQQIERSHKHIEENNQKIFEFMEKTFQQNTKAISEMVMILKEHVRQKDEAIEMLKSRR